MSKRSVPHRLVLAHAQVQVGDDCPSDLEVAFHVAARPDGAGLDVWWWRRVVIDEHPLPAFSSTPEDTMDPNLIEAARVVANNLTQFAYGEIDTATTPYIGDVSLTPAQYRALVALGHRALVALGR